MAEVAAAQPKKCIACGTDCSKKPRMKDTLGRYTCQPCIDAGRGAMAGSEAAKAKEAQMAASAKAKAVAAKAAAPKAPPPAPVSKEADFLSVFGSEPSKLGTPCEQCGAPMNKGAIICVRCGLDRESGKKLGTRVQAAPREKGGPSKIGGAAGAVGGAGFDVARLLMEPAVFSALGFAALVALFFAAKQNEGLMPVYFAGFAIYGLVAWLGMVVTAFMDGHKGWGILGIVAAFVPIGVFPVVYYLLMVAERRWLTLMWFGQIILLFMSWSLIVEHMPG